MNAKKRRRLAKAAAVLGAALCLLLGGWLLLERTGSPLLPGSLERRYTRLVEAHREELTQTAQRALETGKPPEDLPLTGTVRDVELWDHQAAHPDGGAVAFSCGGWGLVPSSSYYGFYYSPSGPVGFQGTDVELSPQDGGYAWQGEGDNHGFTRQIAGDFYYYEAHF